jgi:hypothetical protein
MAQIETQLGLIQVVSTTPVESSFTEVTAVAQMIRPGLSAGQ